MRSFLSFSVAFIGMNCPLITAFPASHNFGMLYFHFHLSQDIFWVLFWFLLWPFGCSIFHKSVKFLAFFLYLISSFRLLCLKKMLHVISVFLDLLRLVLWHNVWCILKIFLLHLRKMCILLLLDGMFYKCLLSPPGLRCCLSPLFPYWFSVWMIYLLMKVRYWSPLLLFYCCLFLSLVLLIFALYIQVLQCWVHKYLQFYILLVDCHYLIIFFASYYSPCLKVYFIWYEYSYSSFLLNSICMEYLFPSPHFQSVCVPGTEVGLL